MVMIPNKYRKRRLSRRALKKRIESLKTAIYDSLHGTPTGQNCMHLGDGLLHEPDLERITDRLLKALDECPRGE